MSILIVGSDGSMGRRYQSILRYLGKEFVCVDKKHNNHFIGACAKESEGVIIATPTDTHAEMIRMILPAGKPILCEKPVLKDIPSLKSLVEELKASRAKFKMMFQYKVLVDPNRIGRSHYDYFRHGSDGLVWDCMQIVALARKDLKLGETSPIWRCMINGKALSISHMDSAYIHFVQNWLKQPQSDFGELIAVHERTAEAAESGASGNIH